MRILHATKRYPNSMAGDSMVVYELERHQQASGHEVFLVTTNCPDIIDKPNLTKVGLPLATARIDKISPRRIITLGWMSVWAFWYLRRIRPDVIHSHTMDFGFALSFAARAYGIPMINMCHGTSFNNPQFPKLKRELELFLIRHAGYRRILTVDSNSLVDFEKAGFSNVSFMPNGVDLSRFPVLAAPYTGGKLKLFNVGRMERVKGIPVLLKALQALQQEHPDLDWDMTFAGGGQHLAEYKKQAVNWGLSDRVHFLGPTLPADTAKLFTSSHMYVMPSLHEGFPIVMLEAWAAGLPQVVTSVGTISTVCTNEKDSLIVAPGEVQPLKEAIYRLATSDKLRARFRSAGRQLIEKKYNYTVIASQVEDVYHEVMA
jgi:glycosyltransferase involved in cell wall biosynthesis